RNASERGEIRLVSSGRQFLAGQNRAHHLVEHFKLGPLNHFLHPFARANFASRDIAAASPRLPCAPSFPQSRGSPSLPQSAAQSRDAGRQAIPARTYKPRRGPPRDLIPPPSLPTLPSSPGQRQSFLSQRAAGGLRSRFSQSGKAKP